MKHKIFDAAALFLLLSSVCVNAQVTFINDAKVYTAGKAPVIQDVIISGAKITSVAPVLIAPPEAVIVEANGGSLTTGLFNAYTYMGVSEIDAISTTVDTYSDNIHVTAAIKIADAFNPESVMLMHNQINGLSHALVMPASSVSIFAGQAALVELANVPKVVNDSVAVVVQLGEVGQQIAGGSRAGALAVLRNALDEAKDYSANQASANKGGRRDYTTSYADLTALMPVVMGEKPLVVNVSRASDIAQVLNLAKQYQLELILSGVQEGWKLAGAIAAAKVPVIIDPIHNLPIAYETLGARLDNAVLLHKAGVQLLFTGMSWHNTHNAHLVRQSAANAIANGLPVEVAIAAITANPAEVFDLAGTGHIKPGANANLVLWSEDPFEMTSYPNLVMVNGELSKGHSRQLKLRDRYFQKLKTVMANKE